MYQCTYIKAIVFKHWILGKPSAEWLESLRIGSNFHSNALNAPLHHLILPFIIHYYPSSFPTTLHHSQLPFIIPYHPSSFATMLHHSILPFIIPYNRSASTTDFSQVRHRLYLHCTDRRFVFLHSLHL